MHNPLGFHAKALPAAKASMAAHAQGKFWEYADLLFGTKKLEPADLVAHAQALGLDMARFEADRNSQAVADKIAHDQRAMTAFGATGTPAFYLNGKRMKGAKPFAAFKTEIDAAIAEADAAIAAGTPRATVARAMAEKNAGADFVAAVFDGKAVPASARPVGEAGGAPAANPAAQPSRAPEAPQGKVDLELHPDDPYKGPKDAPVVIVEFSDFQ